MCGTCGCSGNSDVAFRRHVQGHVNVQPLQKIEHTDQKHIEQHLLHANDQQALGNRELLTQKNILCLNLVSSPGSGKTTLLETTLQHLHPKQACFVIEGDQQTDQDALRIAKTGVEAIQVNTGTGCHLDAKMVEQALQQMPMQDHSILFVENVGNLVCPALFDLGEAAKVAVISVTEGEDKPLKYPHMFRAASLMVINKIDLSPYVPFSIEKCIEYARQVNPKIEVIELSALKGEGMEAWYSWLENQQSLVNA